MIYLNTHGLIMTWTTINNSHLKKSSSWLLLKTWNLQNIIEFISTVKVWKEKHVAGENWSVSMWWVTCTLFAIRLWKNTHMYSLFLFINVFLKDICSFFAPWLDFNYKCHNLTLNDTGIFALHIKHGSISSLYGSSICVKGWKERSKETKVIFKGRWK